MSVIKQKSSLNNDGLPKVAFIFYDFETTQEKIVEGRKDVIKIHEPNLCVAQQVCEKCMNNEFGERCAFCGGGVNVEFHDNTVENFMKFVLDEDKKRPKNIQNVICLAHNAKNFDSQFCLKYLVEKRFIQPKIIMTGSKIMSMSVGNKIKFLDSINYFHMALSKLPAAYGFENKLLKGTFPHLFNTRENQDYEGPIPDKHYFSPDSMSVCEREKFSKWHDEMTSSNYLFDFKKEIVQYCTNDVDILRMACVAFRKDCIEVGKTCPFAEATTIASVCSRIFRKNFLKPDEIGVLPPNGYRKTNTHSRKSLEWLILMEHELEHEIIHAGRGREYRLKEGHTVDGYYEDEHGNRNVYEFFGCYWHGHTCIKGNQRMAFLSEAPHTHDERYAKTLKSTEKLRSYGYNVKEIWECEFDALKRNNDEYKRLILNHPLLLNDKLNPRDAFYGGRTGNVVSCYEAAPNERIRYVDICSLYPYICKNGRFPLGHPTLYIGEECQKLTGSENDLSNVEGLVKCTVLPPRNLYHPVLPVRMHARLMFPLCRTCCETLSTRPCKHEDERKREFTGTWVSCELQKAVSLGYNVLKIQEIWQYQTTQYVPENQSGGFFVNYINTFLKIKQQASGFPSACNDDISRNQYVQMYAEKEGIQLDIERIEKNPGLRFLAKLCLNSLWGKFGQRENMGTTVVVTNHKQIIEFLSSSDKEVTSILPVNETTCYLNWRYKEDHTKALAIGNVVIAAYTTAQARIVLYEYLEKLGKRVLYYDTDSCIYVERIDRDDEYRVPTGNLLGEMTDELESYGKGSFITCFASCGPKFYTYVVQKPDGSTEEVCKVKGISLNFSACQKINFNSIKELALGKIQQITHTFSAIRRTAQHDVITKTETKTCKANQLKRCHLSSTESVPYGYKKMRM